MPNTNPPAAAPLTQLTGRDVMWVLLGITMGLVLMVLAVTSVRTLEESTGINLPFDYLDGRGPGYAVTGTFFLLQTALITGSVYIVLVRRGHHDWGAVGWRPVSGNWWVWALALGAAFSLFGGLLEVFADWRGIKYQVPDFGMVNRSAAELLVLLPVVGVLGPIGEEILFRGVIYGWMRRRWNAGMAAVISSCLFAIVHIEPLIVIFAFCIGLALAGVFEWSRSLSVPIIAHATNNVIAVFVIFFDLSFP